MIVMSLTTENYALKLQEYIYLKIQLKTNKQKKLNILIGSVFFY